MKSLKILGSYSVVLLTVLSLISCSQKDESECDTIFDCPDGYYCSEDKQCVLMVGKSDNDQKSDDEQMIPDENDNTVLPDNEHPDNNQTVDNNVTPDENDEAVIPDEEEDDDFQHDENFMDKDFIDEDLSDDLSEEDLTESEVSTDLNEETDDDEVVDEAADEDTIIVYDDVTVGTDTKNQWTPLSCGLFKYTRSAGIYLGSEINVSSKITKISWYAESANSTSRPIKIYLKETVNDTHTSITWADMTADATLLFDASVTISAGWNEFVLSAPFNFDKTKNLMVMVEMNKGSLTGGNSYIRYTTSTTRHQTWNADYVHAGSGTIDSARPNIRLSF